MAATGTDGFYIQDHHQPFAENQNGSAVFPGLPQTFLLSRASGLGGFHWFTTNLSFRFFSTKNIRHLYVSSTSYRRTKHQQSTLPLGRRTAQHRARATTQPHKATPRTYMAVSRYLVEESPRWVPRSDTTHCGRETSTRHRDRQVQTKPRGPRTWRRLHCHLLPVQDVEEHASYSSKQRERTQHTARSYMAVTRHWVKESPCWVPRSDTTDCRRETST